VCVYNVARGAQGLAPALHATHCGRREGKVMSGTDVLIRSWVLLLWIICMLVIFVLVGLVLREVS